MKLFSVVAEISPFNCFSKMAAVHHLGFVGTHIVQNLVEIDEVVLVV